MAEEKKVEAAPQAKKEAREGREATLRTGSQNANLVSKAEESKGGKKYKSTVNVTDATPGQVVKVFKKVGLYGECYQVLVRVLDGRDKGNLLRRNIRGPVRENDLIMLKETERDVRAI